ncbi:class I SAM-dependent methyltransferase [Streptomyces sp. PRh5]|uniref:class I SAM-dependent methyltransferase n=1 Tax=Streptomyces sp. PRh5 TaxID=1158056 RepID=UPI0004B852D6|nr:class I SAM-dependent methyltransferase [Streptomyces sp. PRh5]
MLKRPGLSGSGPGPIAPDGSAVELYAELQPGADATIVHAAVPAGATILELGAGTGRSTRGLVELGHTVIAVDESPEMLAHVYGAETVCSTIEDLDLGRSYDAVLMASRLINVADAELCHRMLLTCARHVRPDGVVILERHAPTWFDEVEPAEGDAAGITIALRTVTRPSPGLVSVAAEYRSDGRVWTQSFTARRIDDHVLAELLCGAGLAVDSYLTPDRTWVRAVPTAGR